LHEKILLEPALLGAISFERFSSRPPFIEGRSGLGWTT
jgi:hypothetical protein